MGTDYLCCQNVCRNIQHCQEDNSKSQECRGHRQQERLPGIPGQRVHIMEKITSTGQHQL